MMMVIIHCIISEQAAVSLYSFQDIPFCKCLERFVNCSKCDVRMLSPDELADLFCSGMIMKKIYCLKNSKSLRSDP